MRTGSPSYRVRSAWYWLDANLERLAAVLIPALALLWTACELAW